MIPLTKPVEFVVSSLLIILMLAEVNES